MTNYLIIPGLGNSGPEHWQTYFQNSGDHFFRIEQQEWDAPDCEAWVTTLDKKVLDFDLSSVVLVGHSLGCSTIAHWAKKYKRQIKGALLVAPSDPEADQYTFPATGFAPIPLDKINFKTIVVASANDIWVSLERAKFFADHWGSAFINLGNAGHINVASGHTNWDEGMRILKTIILTITFLFALTNIFGQPDAPKLKLSHLTGDFYIYTTYNTYEGNKIPANGMYLVTNKGVVLFDTPWDTTQFQPLLDSIKLNHNKNVTMCIATHWHPDRTAGLEYYKKLGIKTYTTLLTDELSKRNDQKRAEFVIEKDTVFNVGQYAFETYYPGQGHTADNIVIWVDKEKILYGGCLIKGADAENLGYLGDGNVVEYETTLKKVQKKYPHPKFIIVSHHDWHNINALKHSIKLAEKLAKKHALSYKDLKEYEGLYTYLHGTTFKIAASPVDTSLLCMINESRYPFTTIGKDLFLNPVKDTVLFFRDRRNKVIGCKAGKDTFNLLSQKVRFPKQMWYPRLHDPKNYQYAYHPPKNDHDGLETGNLDNTGLDKKLLQEMVQKIIDGTYPNVHSVLIIKDGKLVFEEYFYEHDKYKLHALRSATKSFVSALTGIAIDKGYIKSKDEKVLSYFPEYTFQHNTEEKKQITLENLLTNQSGLDCDVYNSKAVGNESIMAYEKDWIQYSLDLPMNDRAGGIGQYCSSNPIILGRIIEKATQMSLPAFAQQTLFKDMGIKNFAWHFKPDPSSGETFCQLNLRSRDMAKFGLLYLNNGFWNGKQVIPKDWVAQSLAKHSVVAGLDYGYLWWTKYLDADGVRYYGKLAQGNGGQKIYIFKELNLVTVITAGHYNMQSSSNELNSKYILPAFNKK